MRSLPTYSTKTALKPIILGWGRWQFFDNWRSVYPL